MPGVHTTLEAPQTKQIILRPATVHLARPKTGGKQSRLQAEQPQRGPARSVLWFLCCERSTSSFLSESVLLQFREFYRQHRCQAPSFCREGCDSCSSANRDNRFERISRLGTHSPMKMPKRSA